MSNGIKRQSELSLCVAVWGKEYTETFLNFCLTSMLSEKNLPEITKTTVVNFSLYTDDSGLQAMEKSENFVLLQEVTSVEVYMIKGFSVMGNYMAMNDCHRHFIRKNTGKSACVVCPDVIFSNGSLSYLYNQHQVEEKTVCINTPRLDKSTFLESYKKKLLSKKELALCDKELLCLSLCHLHPETIGKILNAQNAVTSDVGGFYLKDSAGLIGCQFHWYPLIFKITENTEPPDITIDCDFLDKNPSACQNIILVNNAINCCVVDLTIKENVTLFKGERTVEQMARWAKQNARSVHLKMFDEMFYFRKEKLLPSDEVVSDAIVVQTEIKKMITKIDVANGQKNKLPLVARFSSILRNNNMLTILKKIERKVFVLMFGGVIIKKRETKHFEF